MGARRTRLSLAEAPDVMTVDEFSRVMGWGINYASEIVNAGLVVNIGGQISNRRIPKASVIMLLEQLARREVTLPPRQPRRRSVTCTLA
jgi:hypothetical protein